MRSLKTSQELLVTEMWPLFATLPVPWPSFLSLLTVLSHLLTMFKGQQD